MAIVFSSNEQHGHSTLANMSFNGDEKAVYASEKGVPDPHTSQYEEGEVVGEVIDFGEKKDLK